MKKIWIQKFALGVSGLLSVGSLLLGLVLTKGRISDAGGGSLLVVLIPFWVVFLTQLFLYRRKSRYEFSGAVSIFSLVGIAMGLELFIDWQKVDHWPALLAFYYLVLGCLFGLISLTLLILHRFRR